MALGYDSERYTRYVDALVLDGYDHLINSSASGCPTEGITHLMVQRPGGALHFQGQGSEAAGGFRSPCPASVRSTLKGTRQPGRLPEPALGPCLSVDGDH